MAVSQVRYGKLIPLCWWILSKVSILSGSAHKIEEPHPKFSSNKNTKARAPSLTTVDALAVREKGARLSRAVGHTTPMAFL